MTLVIQKTFKKLLTNCKFLIEAIFGLYLAWTGCVFEAYVGVFGISTLSLEHTNAIVVIFALLFRVFECATLVSGRTFHFDYPLKSVC